jgi:hypothetical protein
MAKAQNKMGLPPGLGVPSHLQSKLKRINETGRPYRPVPANQYGPSVKTVGKGSLIHFNYIFWIHDPQPLVIITDIFPRYIRGVNLHYLTFPYIKTLLQGPYGQPMCDNRSFSYYNIKGDQYIVGAFRTYKREGIRRLKSLDCSFILNVMASTRTLDPNEVEQIRAIVKEQIRQRIQPSAEDLTSSYMKMMQGESQQGFENITPTPVIFPQGQ